MKTLAGIAVGAVLMLVASACLVYSPPSYAQQDLAYVDFESLREASDRIVTGRFIGLTLELSENELPLRYLRFEVEDSYKGSAEKGDEVAVVEHAELSFVDFGGSSVELTIDASYTLFLKGRARQTEYPAQYGGTVWTLNGDPAIAVVEDDGGLRFLYRTGFVRDREPVEFKIEVGLLAPKSSVPSEPHLFYAI